MGDLSLTFLPPQNWQDFEKFLKGVVDVIWKQESWQIYGRPGQGQSGIDLFGYDDRRRFTGIQSKKKSLTNSDGQLLVNSLLKEKEIDDEIASAESIADPKLDRLIFATTSSRDTKVQDMIRAVSHERQKRGKFIVDIWFWEDFQVLIENHIELKYWYYSELLERIHKYDKDIHILTMMRKAFTRPAFNREIRREESGVDFIQAIKNTMEAITTGRLYNRKGDLITTSYDYKKLSREDWKKIVWDIYKSLDRLRDLYQEGIAKKAIEEFPTWIDIKDKRIEDQFNLIRSDSLKKMNRILSQAGLDQIDSELTNR